MREAYAKSNPQIQRHMSERKSTPRDADVATRVVERGIEEEVKRNVCEDCI